MKTLLAILAVLLAPQLHAQLGKTYLELAEKYGPAKIDRHGKIERGVSHFIPLEISKSAQATWGQDVFLIQVAWMAPEGANGPADYVRISNSKGMLTKEQMAAILDANGGIAAWSKGMSRTMQKAAKDNPLGIGIMGLAAPQMVNNTYFRKDGASAYPISLSMTITLKSPRLQKAEAALEAKKKAEKERLPNL